MTFIFKVNTPRRIQSYLGAHFTGCLIIVPVSDIVLVSTGEVTCCTVCSALDSVLFTVQCTVTLIVQ